MNEWAFKKPETKTWNHEIYREKETLKDSNEGMNLSFSTPRILY